MSNNEPCPTCNSIGFDESKLGSDRCTFCDGTEGGLCPFCTEPIHEGEEC